MEMFFIISVIVFSVLLLLSLVASTSAIIVCYKVVMKNFELQDSIQQYSKFFEILVKTIQEDTIFLRSELARTLKGAEQIPQYKELNSAIIQFETHVQAIEQALKELKLIEDV